MLVKELVMKERKAKLRQKAEDEVLTPYWTVSFGIPMWCILVSIEIFQFKFVRCEIF